MQSSLCCGAITSPRCVTSAGPSQSDAGHGWGLFLFTDVDWHVDCLFDRVAWLWPGRAACLLGEPQPERKPAGVFRFCFHRSQVATLRAINHVLRLWNSAFDGAMWEHPLFQSIVQRRLGSVTGTEPFSCAGLMRLSIPVAPVRLGPPEPAPRAGVEQLHQVALVPTFGPGHFPAGAFC